MRILCPLCGFGREMDESKVPARAQMATCPKCAHKFRFRVVDEPDAPAPFTPAMGAPGSASPAEAAAQDPGQPDPMAAQRAAATDAWRRIQGGQPGQEKSDTTDGTPAAPRNADVWNAASTNQPLNAPDHAPDHAPDAASSDQPAQAGQTGRPSPVPFENLASVGFFPGMWNTIRLVLTSPALFFRSMPTSGGMSKPLAFHLLLAEVMVVCQYLWSLAGVGAAAQYMGDQELMNMGMGMTGAAPVMLFIVYPLMLVLRVMVLTGVIHLLLKLVRSGQSGAEATFRVLCYSAAPLLLGVIPFLGPVIGGVWSIGLTILGLKEAHRSRLSPAMFAVLVPILMMLAAVLGLIQGGMKG